MSQIHVRIITPVGLYKEFDASIVNIQTEDGDQGILPNHMPIVTMLKVGKMECEEETGRNIYAVSGGLFYFHDNTADILSDAVENKNDIDIERALQAKERAENRIKRNDPNLDLKRAELALKKAMNRINIHGK